jgi:hypothetical protein
MPGYLWRRVSSELRTAFQELCGYTAMWISEGTVDHFVSRSEDRTLAFEWGDFRYASASINSSKSALRSHQVLDPFDVGEGWFEVILPSCQMVITSHCPPEYADRAQNMLKRLKLGDGEDIVRVRLEWYRMYCDGELSLEGLARKAPLIAQAVRKQLPSTQASPTVKSEPTTSTDQHG